MKMIKADVSFCVDGKKHSFTVVHNLPKIHGLSFEDALNNWIYRTAKYSATSLCKYIMGKHTGYVCMTMATYNRLNT